MVEIKLADLSDASQPSLYWLRLDSHEVEHSFFKFSPVTGEMEDTENKYPTIDSLIFMSPPVEVDSDEYLGMMANGIDPDEYYRKSIDANNLRRGLSLMKEMFTDGIADEEAIEKTRKNFAGRITHDLEIRDSRSSQDISSQIDDASSHLPEVLNYALTKGDE